MPTYQTPGVYVEEVAGGPRPIQAQSTSTPVFVGTGGRAELPEEVEQGVPRAVNNWSEYARLFLGEGPMTPLSHAVNGFFLNTQGRCYVLDLGPDATLKGTPGQPGLSVLESIEDISIVAAPGLTSAADHDAILSHCERMRDRVAILDAARDVDDILSLTRVATAASAPASSTPTAAAPAADGDPPAADPAPSAPRSRPAAEAHGARPSDFGTLYYPWVQVRDLMTGDIVTVPPSGHLAGLWARTDATRGVHKAPANEPLRGVVGVHRRVTPAEQGELNMAGVNVIRLFDRTGVRPWGARTISDDPEWRYLNVRRLFCMVEESIALGTQWIVFEPNDRTLWNMIVRDITAFLMALWRDGALMGRTPKEAFFVKCDEETNPPDVVDAGRVVALVGLAPVKPAEFIIFQVSQFAGGTLTEEVR